GVGSSGGLVNGINGNSVGVDPRLSDGPISINGAPYFIVALLPGSPAIDAGSNALAVDPTTGSPLTTDERGAGFPRIIHGIVDIGAFETPVFGNPTHYTVNLTSDTGASSGTDAATGDPSGDLLWAITQANANLNPAGSVIQFDPTVFNATSPQTITLNCP